MKFHDLRIGAKLWLAVASLIAALACTIAFAAWRTGQASARSDAAVALAERKIDLATRWANMTEAAVGRIVITATSSEPAVHAVVNQSTAKAIAEINELQKQLGAMPRDAAESAQMAKIAELRKHLLDVTAKMKTLQDGHPSAEARAASAAEVAKAAEPYLQAQAEFVKMEQAGMEQVRADFRAERASTLTIVGGVLALVLGAIVAGAALLIRAIRQPLAQAVDLADAIAAGNLTRRSAIGRADEFGDLMRALDAMSDALARTVGQVRSAADQIATGTGQIAVGNQDLSQRTEEQASSLQHTAASMEQLGSTVRTNADAARQATQLASAASAVAVEGGTAVSHVVATMEAISESSRRIADIIGTIDGIAFQTNILALNAAVEAARAGEQGRGFAVVAGEVRNLAHRAADAAKEIKALIQDSVSKVERGTVQVGEAGRTMADIVHQVKRVNDLIGEISAATLEQTQGIGQVGHTVSQLDQVTQQNAALVEQSAAAAASLNQQAARLVEAVGAFTLGESEARIAIAQARATSRPTQARKPRPQREPAPAAVDDADWQQF